MIAESVYLKPKTVSEAIAYAMEYRDSFRFLAGGTDVIVNKFQGNDNASCIIDLTGIKELSQVVTDENVLKIGSLVRLDDLQKHAFIAHHFQALVKAAHEVGSPLIRKVATIGGNLLCENRCSFYNQSEWWREAVGYCLKCEGEICIATGGPKSCFSKFVSDTAPVLISMDAQLEICDENGTRTIPLEEIYTGDGVVSRNLPDTAIIKFIIIPTDRNFSCVFRKLRPREAVDFTSLTTAVTKDIAGKLKIVIGGIDPKPIVVTGVVNGNYEDYIKQALRKSRVVDNDYYSRNYRKDMISVFLEQSFESLIS